MEISQNHINCKSCAAFNCVLKVLTKEELGYLKNNSISMKIHKGEMLFRQNTPVGHIFFIKKGLVKIFIENSKSKSTILNINNDDTFLGVRCSLGDGFFQFSAMAIEESDVCFIDPTIFKKYLKENASFSYEILSHISRESLALNVKLQSHMVSLLPGKVADVLLYFAEIIFKNHDFELPITKKEFAQFVGASRERVSRILGEFTRDNIIQMEEKKIKIKSVALLKQLSQLG